MVHRVLLPLALAACGSAAVLPREPHPGFVSFPISRQTTSRSALHRRAADDTDVPLYNISSVSYLIALSVGSPGQTVKVAIDTGSDELWVNPICSASSNLDNTQIQECQDDGQYDPDSSSSSKQLQSSNVIPYGKGKVAIDYFTDDISLPDSDIKMSSVQFGVATDSEDLNEGILGLGFGEGDNLKYSNFVDELAAQNVTNSKAFSVALGSVDADNGGVIVFGGVDTKKFSGKLATMPILGPQNGENIKRYWVQMDSIGMTSSSGSSKTYSGGKTPIVLDSGSSLSYLPTAVVQAMSDDLGGEFDQKNQLFFVPCSKATSSGSFDFTFSGNKISVPLDGFIWNIDGVHCAIGAQPVDATSGVTALLGDTFMRSAYVVFDQTSNNIYMAPYANCGQNEQQIPSGDGAAGKFSGECEAGQGTKGNAGSRVSGSASNALVVGAALVCLQTVMSFI